MSERFDGHGHGRRTFLSSLAALGAMGALSTTGVAAAQQDDSLDDYHAALRDSLTNNQDLPAGQFVYGTEEATAIDTFSLTGTGSGAESSFDVENEDVPITVADRLEVNEEPSNNWDYSYQGFVTDGSFEAGDVLLGVAYIRSETDGAETQAGFKYRYEDSEGSTSFSSTYVQDGATVEPDGEWQRYYFPIEVGEKPDGSAHEPYMEFWAGFAEQTLEFGGMALVDYSETDVAVGDLPSGAAEGGRNPLLDYEGRAEDAQWRQDAQERIQDIRTADLEVTVVDANGNTVPEATVEVAQTEHAFDFGSAVSANHINGDSEDDATYRETFLEEFNKAVIENGLKYPSFTGAWGDSKDDTIQSLEWLDEQDMPTRGHYLMWEEAQNDGGGGMAIEDADSLSDEELQSLLLDRIQNHAEDVGDLVTEWDMHNHPIWQPNFRSEDGRGLGWDAVLEWWETGAAATDGDLYTNEMGNVAGDFFRSQHLDLVERLLEDDAPIDGAGFMGHVQFPNGNVTPPKEMLTTYDQYAELDVPVLITEFDIQIGSRDNQDQVEWQTDFLRDFLTAAFSHEAVEGIMSWGFWAEDHWRPTGAYYNSDWTLRPHGEQYMDLVFDQWWTEEEGETDESGAYTTSAFKGDYDVTASFDGESSSTTATVEEGGSSVELTLDVEVATETPTETPTDTPTDSPSTPTDQATTDANGPGFGIGAGVAGLGGAGAYALSKRGEDEEAD